MQTPTHKKKGLKQNSPKMDRASSGPKQAHTGAGTDDTVKPTPRVRAWVKAAVTKKSK